MDAAAAGELAPGVWERGAPTPHSGPPAAFAFPLPGVGVMGFSTAAPLEPDATLLATMDSLGSQISQFVERCRAQADRAGERRAQERDPRTPPSTASSRWTTTATWSRSTARPSDVRLPRRGDDRPRAGRADRPAELARGAPARARALRAHRARGASAATRSRREGMRADGSEFPVELIVTRADLPGPPLFCGYLRDVTEARERERDLRRLAAEQAALRRVATAVAAEHDPRHAFAVVTEEVARLLGAQSSNMVRFDDERAATVVGALERGRRAQRAGRRHGPDGRRHGVGARVPHAARRRGSTATTELAGELAARLRALGFHVRGRRADLPRRAAVGRGDRLERRAASRSRPAPSSGSRTSPSSPRRRWPTRRRARSSPPRARASSRPATPSAGGWSATCTTARSSGSSRWR